MSTTQQLRVPGHKSLNEGDQVTFEVQKTAQKVFRL